MVALYMEFMLEEKCVCFVFCSKPVKISEFVTYLEKLEKDSGLKLTEEYEVIHSVYDSYLIAMIENAEDQVGN